MPEDPIRLDDDALAEMTPVAEPKRSSFPIIYAVLAGIVLVSFGFVAWRMWAVSQPATQYSTEVTPYDRLVTSSSAFADATTLASAGQYQAAKSKFEEALRSASDSQQRAQIRFKIVSMDEELGNYLEAIRGYKALVADPEAYSFIRAYAIQRLGSMYYTYGYENPEIDVEIFIGEPYESFVVAGEDASTRYKRLFEYASTFHPLAYGEARIADWYVNEARRVRDAGGTEKEYAPLLARAREALSRVDSDLGRVQNDPNEKGIVASVMSRKGEVLGKLVQFGMATTAEAGAAFQAALELAALGGVGTDGYVRFQYASYLERTFGNTRAADIAQLMAPFYQSRDVYDASPATAFIRSQRNQDTWMHDSLSNMAAMDPVFKTYLQSLGWTEQDFL